MTRVQAIDHLRGMGHPLEEAKQLADVFMDIQEHPTFQEAMDLMKQWQDFGDDEKTTTQDNS